MLASSGRPVGSSALLSSCPPGSGISAFGSHGRPAPRRTAQPCRIRCAAAGEGDTVLVAGATGGVGQVACAKLLERGYKVRALARNAEKAAQVLGKQSGLEIVTADLREAGGLREKLQGVDAICWAVGTTAFPSQRWKGGNPEETDLVSFRNLLAALPGGVKRVVFTSSAGVERQGSFPYLILNAFGVLKYKRQAEQLLEGSGLPFVLLRPGRLTDGPYTSYDLNTLLQATAGSRQDVQLTAQEDQNGEASRIAVAEAMVQLLSAEDVEGRRFSLVSREGDGPGQDTDAWRQLFTRAYQ